MASTAFDYWRGLTQARMICLAALITVFVISAPAIAGPLKKGEAVTVRGVIDGDTVRIAPPLGNANEVRLVGIQAPKLPLGRPGFAKWPLADEAKKLLAQLTLGKTLTLSYGGRRLDRHGRILAHLHDGGGAWIQGEMLKMGLARVYSFADNRALIGEMLDLEGAARAARRGIWDNRFYEVRQENETRPYVDSFQLVEGRVLDVAVVRGRAYLNFGNNWRTDFTISISPSVVRLFRRERRDLLALKDKRIRVRGWLKSYNGPMIEATHPEQIEILK